MLQQQLVLQYTLQLTADFLNNTLQKAAHKFCTQSSVLCLSVEVKGGKKNCCVVLI